MPHTHIPNPGILGKWIASVCHTVYIRTLQLGIPFLEQPLLTLADSCSSSPHSLQQLHSYFPSISMVHDPRSTKYLFQNATLFRKSGEQIGLWYYCFQRFYLKLLKTFLVFVFFQTGSHSVAHIGLIEGNPPVSASLLLWLQLSAICLHLETFTNTSNQ